MMRFDQYQGCPPYDFERSGDRVILYVGLNYIARGTIEQWQKLFDNLLKSEMPIYAGPNLIGAYHPRLKFWYIMDPNELNPVTPSIYSYRELFEAKALFSNDLGVYNSVYFL